MEAMEEQATKTSSVTPLKKKVTLKSKKVGYNPEAQEELDDITPLASAPKTPPRLSVDKSGEQKKVRQSIISRNISGGPKVAEKNWSLRFLKNFFFKTISKILFILR